MEKRETIQRKQRKKNIIPQYRTKGQKKSKSRNPAIWTQTNSPMFIVIIMTMTMTTIVIIAMLIIIGINTIIDLPSYCYCNWAALFCPFLLSRDNPFANGLPIRLDKSGAVACVCVCGK